MPAAAVAPVAPLLCEVASGVLNFDLHSKPDVMYLAEAVNHSEFPPCVDLSMLPPADAQLVSSDHNIMQLNKGLAGPGALAQQFTTAICGSALRGGLKQSVSQAVYYEEDSKMWTLEVVLVLRALHFISGQAEQKLVYDRLRSYYDTIHRLSSLDAVPVVPAFRPVADAADSDSQRTKSDADLSDDDEHEDYSEGALEEVQQEAPVKAST
jgi:hypothetical protein